jgi:hypothetical protein
MSVGSISPSAFRVATAGAAPDPAAQRAQANAQADLLMALKGANMSSVVAARVTDGAGVDLYL